MDSHSWWMRESAGSQAPGLLCGLLVRKGEGRGEEYDVPLDFVLGRDGVVISVLLDG